MMGARGPIASVTALPGVPPRTDRPVPKRVTLDPVAPDPPADLVPVALAEWERIVPDLNAKGLLARVDRAVLVTYCDAVAKQDQARRLLETEGLTIEGANNTTVKHPAWMIYAQAGNIVAQLAKELFASPNARLRSQLPEAADDTEGESVLD